MPCRLPCARLAATGPTNHAHVCAVHHVTFTLHILRIIHGLHVLRAGTARAWATWTWWTARCGRSRASRWMRGACWCRCVRARACVRWTRVRWTCVRACAGRALDALDARACARALDEGCLLVQVRVCVRSCSGSSSSKLARSTCRGCSSSGGLQPGWQHAREGCPGVRVGALL